MVRTIITASKQIVKKSVNGRIYVYERTPYYDKEIRNTKYHYHYIGKEINGATKRIRSILPRRGLIYGPFIPLLRISESIGIMEMLKTYLTEDECNRVIALPISKIVRPSPQSSDLDPPRSDTFLPSFEEFNMFVPPNLFFDPFPSEILILN